MIVIPIGLRVKWPNKPIFTWLLMSAIVGHYAFFEPAWNQVKRARSQLSSVQQTEYMQRRLLVQHCPHVKNLKPYCATLKKIFIHDKVGSMSDVRQSYVSALEAAQLKPSQRTLILNYVLNPTSVRSFEQGIQSLKEYPLYQRFVEQSRSDENLLLVGSQWLTSSSSDQIAVLKAFFFVPNVIYMLLILLILGMFTGSLENRMGPIAFVSVYFFGAAAGLGVDYFLGISKGAALTGVPAGVAAVIGAHCVLFGRNKYFFWVNYFFLFSARRVLPSFLVGLMGLGTLALVMYGFYPVGFAGLGAGLVVGACIGTVKAVFSSVASPFTYQFEANLASVIENSQDFNKIQRSLVRLVEMNGHYEDATAFLIGRRDVFRKRGWQTLNGDTRRAIEIAFPQMVNYLMVYRKYKTLYEIIESMWHQESLGYVLSKMKAKRILAVAKQANSRRRGQVAYYLLATAKNLDFDPHERAVLDHELSKVRGGLRYSSQTGRDRFG